MSKYKTEDPSLLRFDHLANLYEDLWFWPYRQHLETPNTQAIIGDVRGLSVLDFGCGSGVYSRWLKDAGAKVVVGYDTSKGMLKAARENSKQLGLDIEFTSKLSPQVHQGKYDIVLGIYVLPYASTKVELYKMCSDMGNCVKPGGRLITLPIHPRYNPNPSYYEQYGLRMTPAEKSNCYVDGEKVTLHLCFGKWDAEVVAYYWTLDTLKDALVIGGFKSVTQIDMFTSSTGSIENVDYSLKKYIAQPHACILECKK